MIRYLLLLSIIVLPIQAQTEINYPEVIYGPENIHASWASHPDILGGEDRVVLFRNTFKVDNTSADFMINISADNHYFLYLNGELVTHGPQLSDIQHYKYETLNLKNYLEKGENILAVKVVNFGKQDFWACSLSSQV